MEKLCEKFGIDFTDLVKQIKTDVDTIDGVNSENLKIQAVPGGASVRGYARITFNKSSAPASMVVMILSDPDPAKGVEEVMESGIINELPFINVQKHFKKCGIPVLDIYHYNVEKGLLYLEDLGNTHLRNIAEKDGPKKRKEAFEKAIIELVKIQVDVTQRESDDFLGFHAKFDRGLLKWELDHFTEYAVAKRFKDAPTSDDKNKIDSIFNSYVDELWEVKYAVQHRDYHMDNLLYKDGGFHVIDFQDALMGPLPYDLACLLYDRDTATILGKDLIGHLVDYYYEEYIKRSGDDLDRKAFQRAFELCVIHRMLKVVGRFHFIDIVKKRPEYLHFNEHMIPVIIDYLGRDKQGPELLEIIRKYLPEFR